MLVAERQSVALPLNEREPHMPSSHEKDLSRISAQSLEAITNSRASCDDSHRHTRSSRAAIHRSLQLLKKPFHEGWGKDRARRP